MSSRTLYLLACLATLMAAAYGNPSWPTEVDGIEEQCRTAGHKGACNDINFDDAGLKCWNIACRRKVTTANGHKMIRIGAAVDGTRCAEGKACRGGQCISLRGRRMPEQLGMNPRWQCSEPRKNH